MIPSIALHFLPLFILLRHRTLSSFFSFHSLSCSEVMLAASSLAWTLEPPLIHSLLLFSSFTPLVHAILDASDPPDVTLDVLLHSDSLDSSDYFVGSSWIVLSLGAFVGSNSINSLNPGLRNPSFSGRLSAMNHSSVS